MRIGLFTDIYKPSISGVVVAVETLKKILEENGHEVYIIAMNTDKKNRGYIRSEDCLFVPGIKTGIYDYKIRITYPLTAVRMIKKLNLDVIHSHTEFGIGFLAKSMSKKLNIPQIHTYHTMYQDAVDYITKGLFPKTSREILKMYMKGFFHNTVKEVIVPTEKTKDFLTDKYNIKINMNVIPNGIDVERFFVENINKDDITKLKKKLNLTKDDFIILWVGRLGYEKRIDYLIERQKEIVEKDKNCKLVIVGAGPEEKNLKKLVEENEISDNVIFTGNIPHDEVKNYYQLADVVATASYFETQGLTLVEALASSKPVLCSDDDVFKSVITNGYNGYIFQTKKDYLNAIDILINDNDKKTEVINNARKSAEEYSLQAYYNKIIEVYNNALKE